MSRYLSPGTCSRDASVPQRIATDRTRSAEIIVTTWYLRTARSASSRAPETCDIWKGHLDRTEADPRGPGGLRLPETAPPDSRPRPLRLPAVPQGLRVRRVSKRDPSPATLIPSDARGIRSAPCFVRGEPLHPGVVLDCYRVGHSQAGEGPGHSGWQAGDEAGAVLVGPDLGLIGRDQGPRSPARQSAAAAHVGLHFAFGGGEGPQIVAARRGELREAGLTEAQASAEASRLLAGDIWCG